MAKEFRLCIAGSRGFLDIQYLAKECDFLLKNKVAEGYDIIIVSGTAQGADANGEFYAHCRGYKVERYPAEWDNINAPGAVVKINNYGKAYNAVAGHMRNRKMAEISDAIVVFTLGTAGSANMIKVCKELNKPLRVYNLKEGK